MNNDMKFGWVIYVLPSINSAHWIYRWAVYLEEKIQFGLCVMCLSVFMGDN